MPQWAVAFALQDYPINLYRRMTNRVGMPVAEAREQMVDEAYAAGAKYLWFLDDDVQVPLQCIRKLIYQLEQHRETGVAAVSAVYWLKNSVTEPVMFKEIGGGAFWNWKAGDTFCVDEVGTGCLLLDLEALKDMPRPWFIFTDKPSDPAKPGEATRFEQCSEDLNFCKKVKAFGKRILVDSSIQCAHWDVKTGKSYGAPEDSFPMRDERVSRALTVAGFTTYKELVWLADVVKEKKLILELGSYQGRSTRCLADNTLGKIICFDSFTGIPLHPEDQQHTAIRDSFIKELKSYLDVNHVVLVDGSHDNPEAALPSLNGELADMVFIDGDHSYVGCNRDIQFWKRYLAPGGILCGHDASWPGVQFAIDELSKEAIVELVPGTDLWFVSAWIKQSTEQEEVAALEEMAK